MLSLRPRAHSAWLWEALSIAVAVLTLAANTITLLLYTDHPLPRWPSGITINALISVLTAIFKASLMVPIAEGISQLRWLWYLKPRPLGQIEQWDSASRGSLSVFSHRYIHDFLISLLRSLGLNPPNDHTQNARSRRYRCSAHNTRNGSRSFYSTSSSIL